MSKYNLPATSNKAAKALAKSQDTIRSLRARIRDSGEEIQETALTALGAAGAPYIAAKFLSKDPAGNPVLFGIPGEAAIGGLAFIVGQVSDSAPISNVGKGCLYAAAARMGADLAKK